jgi:hypothetical protein
MCGVKCKFSKAFEGKSVILLEGGEGAGMGVGKFFDVPALCVRGCLCCFKPVQYWLEMAIRSKLCHLFYINCSKNQRLNGKNEIPGIENTASGLFGSRGGRGEIPTSPSPPPFLHLADKSPGNVNTDHLLVVHQFFSSPPTRGAFFRGRGGAGVKGAVFTEVPKS